MEETNASPVPTPVQPARESGAQKKQRLRQVSLRTTQTGKVLRGKPRAGLSVSGLSQDNPDQGRP